MQFSVQPTPDRSTAKRSAGTSVSEVRMAGSQNRSVRKSIKCLQFGNGGNAQGVRVKNGNLDPAG